MLAESIPPNLQPYYTKVQHLENGRGWTLLSGTLEAATTRNFGLH